MTRRTPVIVIQCLALICVLAIQSMVTRIPAHGQGQRPSIQIAFVRHGNIWLLNAATSHRIRLTSDGDDNGPTWAAGGTVLFFHRTAGNSVQTMRWQQGQGIKQVRDGLWSPDAAAVAFTRVQGSIEARTTVWVTRDGQTNRITPVQSGYSWVPLAWSPDSSRLVLARYVLLGGAPSGAAAPLGSASLWVTSGTAESGRLMRLPMPHYSPGHAGWPDIVLWSPDGRFLTVGLGPNTACNSCRADGRPYSIVPAAGGKVVSAGWALSPDEAISWAPNGSYLVISGPGGRETYADKYLTRVDPASGSRRTLSRDPSFADVEPAVSPDGNQIAFARGRAQDPSGRILPVPLIASRHVYVLEAGGTGTRARRLTFARGWTDESPVWSPDGQWIVFVRWRRHITKPAAAQLWAVRPNGTDAQRLTSLDLPAGFNGGFGYYGSFDWTGLFAVAPLAYGHVPATSTATPTPSLTPTPMPVGRALIELMRKAMVARRTVRVSSTSQSTWTGHSVLSWTWMDMDLQSNTMREVDTTQRARPDAPSIAITVERRELVVSGGEGAARTPGHTWFCEHLKGVRVRNGLIPFQVQSANVTNLGPAKVVGISVWHVRARNAAVSAWSTNDATVDLYISRSDNTPVQLMLNTVTRLGGQTEHVKVTETYGRYGKAVTVTMPRECR